MKAEPIDLQTAFQVSGDAKQIVLWQEAIAKAREMIGLLEQDLANSVDIELRAPLRSTGYVFPVSAASAIQLLKESIEITSQHVQVASDRLRSTLNEPER